MSSMTCFMAILFVFHACHSLGGLWSTSQAKLDAMQAKIEGLERVQLKERDLKMTQTLLKLRFGGEVEG